MNEKLHALSVRLPVQLADRIRAQANRERRSVNAEIVRLLELALTPSDPERTPAATQFPGSGNDDFSSPIVR